jgi:hypothetical protein
MPDRYGDNEWPKVPTPGSRPPDVDDVAAVEALDIVNCSLCNDDGMRGMHRCDHRTDHAAAAKRWMPVIREVLGKNGKEKAK